MEQSGNEVKMGMKKRKILIVDDSEMNRSLLAEMLCDQFEILEAENGMEASMILYEREQEISLMLLDIVMPVMDGFEMLAAMNKNGWIKSVPVIMISAESIPTYVDKAYDLGVMDYISRPFDERIVRRRVLNTMKVAEKQNELFQMVMEQIYEKEKGNRLMIEILSNIVEFRNGESGLHVLHIHTLTELLLRQLLEKTTQYGIAEKNIPLICNASALHDIGKIGIPDEILNKPGRLTAEEYEIMKTHSEEGARILQNIYQRENEPLIQVGYQICRWHHERYDGRGYPDGLKGDDIPIAAQVVALADVYDALTSRRVYKPAFSHEKAMQMIMDGECGCFNPILLECLKDISEVLKKEFDGISLNHNSQMEIMNTVETIIDNSNLNVSERSFKLLERERQKSEFYSELSRDILFEYVKMPEIIKLSNHGAEILGLPRYVLNPRESAFASEVFSPEDFSQLIEMLEQTTPEQPVVQKICVLTIQGKKQRKRILARSLWSVEGDQQFEGAIGKIESMIGVTQIKGVQRKRIIRKMVQTRNA